MCAVDSLHCSPGWEQKRVGEAKGGGAGNKRGWGAIGGGAGNTRKTIGQEAGNKKGGRRS